MDLSQDAKNITGVEDASIKVFCNHCLVSWWYQFLD
jgi:hypothetical protein